MSSLEPTTEATIESMRPSSAWTNDSAFADSAISMGARTPKQHDDDQFELRSPTFPKLSLSERLTQLAAAAWATEQDGFVDETTRERAWKAVRTLQDCLDDNERESQPGSMVVEGDQEDDAPVGPESGIESSQLNQLQEQLTSTVAAMRLRRQEQRHVHELCIQRLSEVTGTCSQQRQTIRDMQQEVDQMRIENQKMLRDNQGFEAHAEQLTAELEQKDVALQAMSSAVAGLDGWIQSSIGTGHRPTRRVRATRGRGRFQTHYYVDVPIGNAQEGDRHDDDGTLDVREFREGITAWVRGFRDVEDAVHTVIDPILHGRAQQIRSVSQTRGALEAHTIDDDWGEFQRPELS
jgi:hypothetical protein